VFDWAAGVVRDEFEATTWKAFWETAVEDKPVKDVAAALGVSVGAVYVARCRVMARLREAIGQVDD
jgi:RNA polymerase sigma-70 factor (ECF subfamily)